MPFLSKTDARWLASHGVQDSKTNGWTCKKNGADINAVETGRSIHSGLFPGANSGEVRQVLHFYCTSCNPDYEAPPYGTPIQERELIEVS